MHFVVSLCFAVSLLHGSTAPNARGRHRGPPMDREPHPVDPRIRQPPRVNYWDESPITTCKPCSDGLGSLSRKYGDKINQIASTEKWVPAKRPEVTGPCMNPENPGGDPDGSRGGDSSIDGCCHQECVMSALPAAMNALGQTVTLHQGEGSQTQLFHTCSCTKTDCSGSNCKCDQGQRLVLALTSPTSFDYVYINSCCRSVVTDSSRTNDPEML